MHIPKNAHKPVPIGKRFGKVVVLRRAPNDPRYYCARVFVKCDCGVEKPVVERALRRGKITSCGCAKVERSRRVGRKVAANATRGEKGRFAGREMGDAVVSVVEERPIPAYVNAPYLPDRPVAPLTPNHREPNFRHPESGDLQLLKCFVCVPTGRGNQPANIPRGICVWCGWREKWS